MNILRKSLAAILSVMIVVSACLTGITFTVNAAATDNYGDYFGKTDGSGAFIGRADTFSESWENGLDLDKWKVVKCKNNYVADFQVVDDPVAGSNQGKVLMSDRAGTWLIPTDDYYPNGALWGELQTVEFKVYMKDINSAVNGASAQSNNYCPGITLRVITDEETGTTLCRRWDGFMTYSSVDWVSMGQRYKGGKFVGVSTHMINGTTTFGYLAPSYVVKTEGYTPEFDFSDWIDVKITVDVKGQASAVFTDKNGLTYASSLGQFNQSGAKFAIGYMPVGTHVGNFQASSQEWGGQMYVDDIQVTFQPSDFDRDESVGDVDVYYSGNTFVEANETVSLTGERLGSSVLSAQIARMTDSNVTLNDATYVKETDYNAYYNVDANAIWSQIEKENVMSSTDEGSQFSITQRSELGLNIIIPESLGNGMYALLLEAEHTDGEDELVIINNPKITILMGNDGDYATPDGWLKLGGENLSVQDDMNKVSAIILDENGNKLHLLQNTSGSAKHIYVDTTENYGVENEHYMKINLAELNLPGGKYKIMVHNGYGGDYGWSAPYDFQVGYELTDTDGNATGVWETRAGNMIWRSMGVFNVQDFGAVGDGNANDTAAIQRTINAAVKNGGGMVYFPKRSNGNVGYYRVTNGLDVKQNISFVGDGGGNSILFYDGYYKTTVKQTEYFISYEENFELSNIQLYCNTNYFVSALKGGTLDAGLGKLYIHDVRLYFDATAWRNNSYTAAMPSYNGKTASEWYEIQWDYSKKQFLKTENKEAFILYENVDQDLRSLTFGKGRSDYLEVKDFKSSHFDNDLAASKANFFTNTVTATMRSNSVYRSPYMKETHSNNVEVFLTDSGGVSTTTQMRYVDPNTFREDLPVLLSKCDESHIDAIRTFADGENKGRTFYSSVPLAVGATIAVTDGVQGVGQIRTIESVTRINGIHFVTVDSPFACAPNRNSTVSVITGKPHNIYVNDGDFANGSFVGMYGIAYDIVFSNCMAKNVGSFCFSANYTGFMWYETIEGLTLDGTDYAHNDRPGDPSTMLLRKGQTINGVVFLGLRLSDSTLKSNGTSINLLSGNTTRTYSSYNLVVEDMKVISPTPAVAVEVKGAGGMFVHNVRQYTDGDNLAYSEISPYKSLGSARDAVKRGNLWADNLTSAWMKLPGDINQDDVVSVKDLEELQKYLAGSVEFDDTQITSANLNKDKHQGKALVDARDFLYLRAIIKFRDNEVALREAIRLIGSTIITDRDLNYGIILDYDKAGEED